MARLSRLALALVVMMASAGSYANISCAGSITYLGMGESGDVIIAAGGNIHKICSVVSRGSYSIDPIACKSFYATLLAHRLANKSVAIYYSDPNLSACAQIQPWSTQSTAYFVQAGD